MIGSAVALGAAAISPKKVKAAQDKNAEKINLTPGYVAERLGEGFKARGSQLAVAGGTVGALAASGNLPQTVNAARSVVTGLQTLPQNATILQTLSTRFSQGVQAAGKLGGAFNALPPQAKVIIGVGAGLMTAIGLNHIYNNGKIDGKHLATQNIKEHAGIGAYS